jgi:hypothetical protein
MCGVANRLREADMAVKWDDLRSDADAVFGSVLVRGAAARDQFEFISGRTVTRKAA